MGQTARVSRDKQGGPESRSRVRMRGTRAESGQEEPWCQPSKRGRGMGGLTRSEAFKESLLPLCEGQTVRGEGERGYQLGGHGNNLGER